MQLLVFHADLSGVVTPPPKPVGNTTAPPSVPVPTTAAPEPPVVNATVQLPVTAQPPVANATMPPMVEVTTNLINKDNVTGVPDNRPPSHPGTLLSCSHACTVLEWDFHDLFFPHHFLCFPELLHQ